MQATALPLAEAGLFPPMPRFPFRPRPPRDERHGVRRRLRELLPRRHPANPAIA